jgi:hypothetical protein
MEVQLYRVYSTGRRMQGCRVDKAEGRAEGAVSNISQRHRTPPSCYVYPAHKDTQGCMLFLSLSLTLSFSSASLLSLSRRKSHNIFPKKRMCLLPCFLYLRSVPSSVSFSVESKYRNTVLYLCLFPSLVEHPPNHVSLP